MHGPGATFGGGRFRVESVLRGHSLHGLHAGTRIADGRPVLIAVRVLDWAGWSVDELRLASPGIAPLLFIGPPDGYRPKQTSAGTGTIGAVIELRPAGVALSERAGTLTPRDIVRVGLGLVAAISAAGPGRALLGVRPETTYLADEPDGPRLSGLAPRSARILTHHHDGYGRAFQHSYVAPEIHTSGEVSATSDLFSAALTLWTAFTGAHAYRVSPEDIDEEVIAADQRGDFPGPAELARILEPVLQADVTRRPAVRWVQTQLHELAHQWGVAIPAFPPPELAGVDDQLQP